MKWIFYGPICFDLWKNIFIASTVEGRMWLVIFLLKNKIQIPLIMTVVSKMTYQTRWRIWIGQTWIWRGRLKIIEVPGSRTTICHVELILTLGRTCPRRWTVGLSITRFRTWNLQKENLNFLAGVDDPAQSIFSKSFFFDLANWFMKIGLTI